MISYHGARHGARHQFNTGGGTYFALPSGVMGRPHRILQSDYPYHIFNKVNNSEFLYDFSDAYPHFLEMINYASKRTDFRPHHFILMGNHYHMIGSTPKSNLNDFMCLFQTKLSKRLNTIYNRSNHFFKSRYGATVLDNERYLLTVIRYVYQNPLRAGIVKGAMSFKYSSLNIYKYGDQNRFNFSWDCFFKSMKAPVRYSVLTSMVDNELEKYEQTLVSCALKRPRLNEFLKAERR